MKGPLREYLVPIYFQIGGVAGGYYALLALLEAAAPAALPPEFRLLALGMPILLAFCGALLTVHLTHPSRFWRVLTRFKWYSPTSVGAWILTVQSLLAVTLAIGILLGSGVSAPPASLPLALVYPLGLGGVLLAGYPGVLLTASSRSAWATSLWIGPAFAVTSLANSSAMLVLCSGSSLGGALLSAEAASTVFLRLNLLALGLWVALDLRVRQVKGYRSFRWPILISLALALVGPSVLVMAGGRLASLGAVAALVLGVLPRGLLIHAGEKRN